MLHYIYVLIKTSCSQQQPTARLKILAVYLLAITVMFVAKLWAKSFSMNNRRSCHQSNNNKREGNNKMSKITPAASASNRGGAINLAYESDTDLRLLTRSMKAANVNADDDRGDAAAGSTQRRREAAVVVAGARRGVIDVRQRKAIASDNNNESSPANNCESSSCRCRNCRALGNLTECGVCLESLQSSQIKTCPVCANVVCTSCAGKLANCAFCRSAQPPERNRALERLVDRLALPCRNCRSGCKAMLDGESRLGHESMCAHAAIACPVGRGACGWHGTVAGVQQHLHLAHNLQPLKDRGISVEIFSFRSKAKAVDGRVYTVCLACYSQLFVIRIVLHQNRLQLCFTRLGHDEPQPLGQRPERYGVSVTIRSNRGSRRLHGLVPFGKFDRESREISITCDSLYPKSSGVGAGESRCRDHAKIDDKDLVKIDLLVRKVEDTASELCADV